MALYTSDSEFDAETRVQITNEVPPVDIYDGLNSVLKNDTWKWLLGFSSVEYGLTVGDSDTDEQPVKIVNGVQADNYGPASGTFHRMEIDGTLMPENDLFLHEIYRYLNCLYPDHPDWLQLLTHNEVIDAFENAAAIVDYKPNDEFFTLVANSIAASGTDDEKSIEAFKLNLRNLKDNAYRRKIYGSSIGYKAFCGDIFQVASCFPLGTYLPLKAVDKTSLSGNLVSTSVKRNYNIDTFDPNYQRRFRCIDWTGTSRDMSATETTKYRFVGFTVPGAQTEIFEKALTSSGAEERSTADNVISDTLATSEFVELSNFTINTTYLDDNITDSTKQVTLSEATDGTFTVTKSEYDTLYGIETSRNLPIEYKTLYTYRTPDNFGDFITLADSCGVSLDLYAYGKDFISEASGAMFMSSLMSYFGSTNIPKVRGTVEAIYNPYVRNTFMLKPSEMLKIYQEYPTYTYNSSTIETTLNADTTVYPSDFALPQYMFVSNNDIGISTEPVNLEQVSGVSKGSIDINGILLTDYSGYNIDSYGPFDVTDDSLISDADMGLIIKSEADENKVQHKVVIFGKAKVTWESLSNGLYFRPKKIHFDITTIPTTKSVALMTQVYGTDYTDAVELLAKYTTEMNKETAGSATYNKYQALVETEQAAIDEMTLNRAYMYADSTYLDASGNEVSYEKSYINAGDTVLGYLEVSTTIADGTFTLTYASPKFLPETGTISHFDYGNVSTLPIVVNSAWATKEDTGVALETFSIVNEAKTFYFAKVQDKYFNINQGECGQAYSYMPESFRKTLWCGTTKTNVTCYSAERSNISIEGVIDLTASDDDAAYTIQFVTEESQKRFNTLTIGDYVYGAGISDDTYITEIGNNSIVVNNKLPHSGTFTLKFSCVLNYIPEDISDDLHNYKVILFNNNSYNQANPFDNGLYGSDTWPSVSNAIVEGLLDPSQFAPYNNSADSFLQVMKYIYEDKLSVDSTGAYTNKLFPSVVKFNNDTFVEMNLRSLINVKNREGDTGNLMNVEWLDYVYKGLDETAKATDNVNVGTNLMLETDTSGYYTLISGQNYTDPSIKTLFQTFDWDIDTIPAYAQIGTAGSGRKKWFKSVDDVMYPNVYGATFYDTQRDGMAEIENNLEAAGGEEKKRGVYESVINASESTIAEEVHNENEVESLLFEIPLGEYDIQKGYTDTNGNSLTTISLSFYKQSFKNITKKLDGDDVLKINNKSVLSNKSLVSVGASIPLMDDSHTVPTTDEDSPVKFEYLGDWKPVLNDDGTAISWPTADLTSIQTKYNITPRVYSYYSVYQGCSLVVLNSDKTDAISVTFNDTSIIMYDPDTTGDTSNPWRQLTFATGGCYGPAPYIASGTDYVLAYAENWEETEKVSTSETLYPTFTTAAMWHALYAYGKSSSDALTLSEMYTKLGASNTIYISSYFKGLFTTADTYFNDFDLLAFVPFKLSKSSTAYTYKLARVNNSNFIAAVQFNQPSALPDEEFEIFTGTYSDKFYKRTVLTEKTSTADATYSYTAYDSDVCHLKLNDDIQSKFTLPRRCITEGSYNFKYTIDPKFLSTGYLYSNWVSYKDSGTSLSEVKFNVSKSPIYYDSDYDCFYTTSDTYDDNGTITQEDAKIVIKFQEQKFYKNVMYLDGAYEVSTSQGDLTSDTESTATISSISGIDFDLSNVSSSDRILKVTEKSVRSLYSSALESIMFSNYSTLSGAVYGITKNGELYVSSSRNAETDYASNKGTFSTEIQKWLPVVYDSSNNATTTLTSTNYDFTTDTQNLGSPKLVNVAIKKPITNDGLVKSASTDVAFTYYKNLLVFEGFVDLSNPNTIYTDNSTQFTSALNQIATGDTVEGIVSINSQDTTRHSIKIKFDTSDDTEIKYPKKVLYANNIVVLVSDNGTTYYSGTVADLSAITELSVKTAALSIIDNSDAASLIDLSYSDNAWYETFSITTKNTADGTTVTGSAIYKVMGNSFDSRTQVFNTKQNVEHWSSIDKVITVADEMDVGGVLPASTMKVLSKDVAYNDSTITTIYEKNDKTYADAACTVETVIVSSLDYAVAVTVNGNKVYPCTYTDSDGASHTIYTKNLKVFYSEKECTNAVNIIFATCIATGATSDGVTTLYAYTSLTEGVYLSSSSSNSTDYSDLQYQQIFRSNDSLDILAFKNQVFVKSKTKTVNSSGTYDGGYSTSRHWKCATIPALLDLTETVMRSKTTSEAYDYVADSFALLQNGISNKDLAVPYDTYYEILGTKIPTDTYNALLSLLNSFTLYDLTAFTNNCFGTSGVCTTNLPLTSDFKVKSGATYTFTAPTETSSGTEKPDYEFCYYKYLALMQRYICCDPTYENLGTSAVNDIIMLSDKVIFKLVNGSCISIAVGYLNSVEDMENEQNWNAYTLPEFTTVQTQLTDNATLTYTDGTTDTEVPVLKNTEEAKTFSLNCSFKRGSVAYFGGYFKSYNTINSMWDSSALTQLKKVMTTAQITAMENAYASYTNTVNKGCKAPALFYTNNGAIESIPVVSLITSDDTLKACHVRVDSIGFTDGSIIGYISYSKDDATYTAYSKQIIVPFTAAGLLDIDNVKLTKIDTSTYGLNGAEQIAVDGGEIAYWPSTPSMGIDVTTKDKNYYVDFIGFSSLVLPASPNNTVTSVGDSYLSIGGVLATKTDSSSVVKAVVSIKTAAQITDQTAYIKSANIDEYITTQQLFKVPTVTEVASSGTADLMYSYRETLVGNQGVNYGYPTMAEDTERKYYEYESYTDSDGNTQYVVKGLTNDAGKPVYLCSDDGVRTLVATPVVRPRNFYSLYNQIIDGQNTDNFSQAGTPVIADITESISNYSYMLDDSTMTSIISQNTHYFNSFEYGVGLYDTSSDGTVTPIGAPYLKAAPKSSALKAYTSYLINLGTTKDYYNNYDAFAAGTITDNTAGSIYTRIANAVTYIQNVEGRFGSINDPYETWSDRFSAELIGDNYYLYDNRYGIFMFNAIRYITADILIPYTYAEGSKVLYNQNFEVSSGALTNDNDLPITSIYYNPKGYGGTRNNTDTDWSEALPWELDPEAFDTSTLLKNSAGDYITIADANGADITVNKGIFDVKAGDAITLTASEFTDDSKTITLKSGTASITQQLAKIDQTDIVQLHSASTFNFYSYNTDNKLVLLRFIKNGTILSADKIALKSVAWYNGTEYTEYSNGITFSYADNYLIGNADSSVASSSIKFRFTFAITYNGIVQTVTTDMTFDSTIVPMYIVDDEAKIRYSAAGDRIASADSNTSEEYTIKIADTSRTYSVSAEITGAMTFVSGSYSDGSYTFSVVPSETYSSTTIAITAIKEATATQAAETVTRSFVMPCFKIPAIKKYVYTSDSTSISQNFIGDYPTSETLNNVSVTEIDYTGWQKFDSIEKFLITPYNSSISLNIPYTGILSGTKGKCYTYAPTSVNFKYLVNDYGFIIENANDTEYTTSLPDIKEIATDKSEFTLSDVLSCNTDWNDGNLHYLELKLLTVADIELPITLINNSKYFVEVDKDEIDIYSPNRVYFNPDGIPQPPVKIGNTIYNTENNYAFYSDKYTNNDGVYIYQCDSDGKLIGYKLSSGKPVQYVLGDDDGDLSANIYYGTDNRFIPQKPIYDTCAEWFKNEFYLSGSEQNPFWQILQIAPKFNITSKKFEQTANLYEYKKSSSKMILSEIDDTEAYVSISKAAYRSQHGTYIKTAIGYDYVDLKNGTIQFVLTQPASQYQTTENFVKYGISYVNSFYDSTVWTEDNQVSIDSYISLNYTINSTEDMANPHNQDKAIADVTEMALFDKNHKIIAYALFPPIEYRTDKHHVSFTCFIKLGNCVQNS